MKSQLVKRSSMRCSIFLLLLLWPALVWAQEQSAAPVPTPATAAKELIETNKAAPPTQSADSSDFWKQFRYSFEMGGQVVSLSGERPSKLEEVRQVREGYLFRKFHIISNPEGSPVFFRLIGKGPSQLDQHYFLDAGKYGSFRTTVEWSGLPHLYSRGSKSLFGSSGPGVFTIPDNIQQTLQNTPDADLPGVMQSFIASAPSINLRVQRETLNFNQKVNLTDHWSVRFRLLDQKRYGSRPLGTGSYERVGTATGDTFRVLSIELPESVDYRHNQLTFGTSYVRKQWGVNFDYTYSTFRNRINSITFDNPFRATDMQATGSGGVFNRAAFAQGIISRPPSNEAHSFLISGFIDLPHNSRWASALGWSFWRQNEPFVPYTLNTAIVATGLPAGTTATQVESLPRPSLEGEVDTFTQDHLFTSRLTKKLAMNLHYRYYDYENKTPEILFPGYAAFGESYWRTNINGKPIENEPVSFLRQRASAELVWDIAKPLRWKWEYAWEGLNRRHRQVARSNEHSIGTQLSYQPTNKFSSKLNYRYSDRTPQNYDPGILEYKFLRMFDQAKRLRHDASLQWQYIVRPQLGISGTFGYFSDDYDQNFFGLSKNLQGYGTVDLLYTPLENTTFYANYSREHSSSTLQSIAKTAVPFDLNNRWNRDWRDVVDSFGAGITTYLARSKMFVDVHYAFSLAKERINNINPFTPAPASVLNATAYPWPDVKTRFHEVNADISYQVARNWAFGVRYIYEPYRLNDFAWDGLKPYPVDLLATENDGRRFLILDSRYSSHTAHVVGIYLRFTR